jgi:hypothetical protein
MISNWKKIFSAGTKEEAPVDPLAIANAKIAGLQDRCDTYERRALNAEGAHARVQRNNQLLGKALHEKVAECDDLRPDAERYRAQRAKAKLNLRQFKNPTPSAHEAARH